MPRDHMERWWLDVLDDSQQSAPTTRHVSKDKWQPPPLNHAQHSSLPRWDPRHCRAETTFPYWAPYKFPCHSICEYNKRAVFTLLNFGVIGFASGRRIWLAVLFCLPPALILAAEQGRSGESLRPCGESMMGQPHWQCLIVNWQPSLTMSDLLSQHPQLSISRPLEM